jgi:hypothetical protein
MKLTRCSKLVLVALLLTVTAVPAAAVSTEAEGVPEDAQVGEEVQATFTLTDLYEDGTDEWTLRGSTGLENATWVVEKRKLSGDTTRESYTGQSFETTVSASDDVDRVTVTVKGTTPELASWSYDPAEQFQLARLVKVAGGQERLGDWQVHHYTEDSREARQAIESAQAAVNDSDSQQAERTLQRAITAYNEESPQLAIDLANEAEQQATTAEQSRERRQLLIYGAIGAVALVLVFGGIYYYRSRQQEYSQLR